MILTEKLEKRFEDFVAVEQVSLDVPRGEVLALLGPNGAGKTTTIRMLTSVLKPTSGRAVVAGFDVEEYPGAVRSSVGVLTENHGLYHRMPAEEYLAFFGQLYGIEAAVLSERINRLAGRFGLGDAMQRRIGEFSKGMRQKLALARAMLHDPPVLLLDEPTSAMDPESARLVRDMIGELRSSDRTVLICTHNLAEAEELADKIAIIRQGKIIENGTTAELRQNLLGQPVVEVKCVSKLNRLRLPKELGAVESARGEDWLEFSSEQPEVVNPQVLRWLIGQGVEVVYMRDIPRSLEKVYLEAVAIRGRDA